MKKIYTILGNKPFEDKLIEQLSTDYIPVGHFDTICDNALNDLSDTMSDTLVVREVLAESPDAFYEFLKQAKSSSPKLKIITVLQPRKVGDEFIFRIASLGVFDIINSGTRLSEVIEMAQRESKTEDVFSLLNEEQRDRLSKIVLESGFSQAPEVLFKNEEPLIEIDGELQIDKDAKSTGFKERYMSGITQVHASVDEEQTDKVALPDLTPNELVNPINHEEEQEITDVAKEVNSFGFNLPGMFIKPERVITEEVKDEPIEIVDEPMNAEEFELDEFKAATPVQVEMVVRKVEEFDDVTALETVKELPLPVQKELSTFKTKEEIRTPNTKQTVHSFFLVSHRLSSSIAMQYAVAKAKTKKIAYIETDARNQLLEGSFAKSGVKFYWLGKGEKLNDVLNVVQEENYDEVILNSPNLMHLKELKPRLVFCEIVQDKEYAIEIKERLTDYPNARIVVSYFEPDLISQKSLNKIYERSSVRWVNTRIEEYNSRLNGKLLQNQSVNELIKEV